MCVLGPLDCASQVESVGIEDQSFRRNRVTAEAIRAAHIEDDFLVREKFIVQAQVIAVRIELRLFKRIDDDVAPKRRESRCR